MLRKSAVLALAIALPGTAGAIEFGEVASGTVDVFATPRVAFGTDSGPSSDQTLYGDGGGVRGTFKIHNWVGMLAEYQNTSAAGVGALVEYRIGPGYLHPSGSGFFVEYKSEEAGDAKLDGFGARGRLGFSPAEEVHAYAELGFAALEGDANVKYDDLHTALGITAPIVRNWGLFMEYRQTRRGNDVDDVIATQDDFRLGVRASLPY